MFIPFNCFNKDTPKGSGYIGQIGVNYRLKKAAQ